MLASLARYPFRNRKALAEMTALDTVEDLLAFRKNDEEKL